MSYWGSGVTDNDFASGSIGATIYTIKKQLLNDINSDIKFEHPEQSIVANLVCLRLIGERFPKALSVHFRKKDYENAKENFYLWYEKSGNKVPKKYRIELLANAESEFALFEKNILEK